MYDLTAEQAPGGPGPQRDSSGILTYTLYWYILSYTVFRGSYTMLVYNSG